jgi:lipopolysaccharide transport system permease protein
MILIWQSVYSMIKHRVLVWEMTKRDLKGINQGALLGISWIFLKPLIQTGAYIVVVSVVFKTRLGEGSGTLDYALYVLSGMIPWQIITTSMQDAPTVIRARIELVKQVIYPIETLPFSNLLVGSFSALVSFIIFVILGLFTGNLHWTIFFLPVPLLLLLLFVMGVSWVFSIIGIIIKDLREMVTVILSLMVYLSPVVVNKSITGAKMWKLIMLNPLAHIIVCFRDVFNATLHPTSWYVFIIMTTAAVLVGGWVINKTKIKINEYI